MELIPQMKALFSPPSGGERRGGPSSQDELALRSRTSRAPAPFFSFSSVTIARDSLLFFP